MAARSNGFTLVELMVAVVLLGAVVLGLGAATSRLGTLSVLTAQEATALELVEGRLGHVMADPAYDSLEVRYRAVEGALAGAPGLSRTTLIKRVFESTGTNRSLDYKLITVRVEGSGLREPVSRTTSRAAP